MSSGVFPPKRTMHIVYTTHIHVIPLADDCESSACFQGPLLFLLARRCMPGRGVLRRDLAARLWARVRKAGVQSSLSQPYHQLWRRKWPHRYRPQGRSRLSESSPLLMPSDIRITRVKRVAGHAKEGERIYSRIHVIALADNRESSACFQGLYYFCWRAGVCLGEECSGGISQLDFGPENGRRGCSHPYLNRITSYGGESGRIDIARKVDLACQESLRCLCLRYPYHSSEAG